MGLMLSRLLGAVLGLANGGSLIMVAFAGTGAVFFGMAALSTVIKRDLSTMGKWLFVGAIVVFVDGDRQRFHSVRAADADDSGARDRHLHGVHSV